MRRLRSIPEVRAAVAAARGRGASIGLVPTMGALHAGHLSLIRAAVLRCDTVVVSLFVNPAQFDEAADLAAYPRDEERDAALASEAGAQVLWAPEPDTVYPPGFATAISVAGPAAPLEGKRRGASHFAGVATVVAKLFNVVAPDVAFFGQKDAQQVAVIRRLVADLDMPVEIAVAPTVREPDGLALSSRNVHLSAADRERALALHAALRAAEAALVGGEHDAARLRALALETLHARGVEPEYVELVEPDGFEPVARIDGETVLAVAARVGAVRLIDNLVLRPAQSSLPTPVSTSGSSSP